MHWSWRLTHSSSPVQRSPAARTMAPSMTHSPPSSSSNRREEVDSRLSLRDRIPLCGNSPFVSYDISTQCHFLTPINTTQGTRFP